MIFQVFVAILGARDSRLCAELFEINLFMGGATALLFWCLTPRELRVRWMGLGIVSETFAHVLLGAGLAAAYYAASLLLPLILGYKQLRVNMSGVQALGGVPELVAVIIVVIFGYVGFVVNKLFGEELAFRGYLFASLERQAGTATAMVIVAAMSAAWHVPYFLAFGADHIGLKVVWIFLGAIPLCLLFSATHSCYAVSVCHAMINLVSQVLVTSEGARTPAIFVCSSSGLCDIIWGGLGLGSQFVFVWLVIRRWQSRS